MASGLKFPLVEDEKYEAKVIFQAKGEGGGQCILYMPEALTFNDQINYDNVNLGIAGMAAMSLTKFTGDAANAAIDPALRQAAMANIQTKAANMMKQRDMLGSNVKNMLADNAAPFASLLAQGLIPSEAISSGIALGSGVTANPHKRSVFRDVSIRNFGFSFMLSPASKAEGEMIEGIVDFFRENAYPDYVSGGKYAYRFPNRFTITFKYGGDEMSQPPKILDCFLQSVNTTFNPRSSSFFSDGKFNETQISLGFVEERPLAKPDVQDGY